jgi:DNA-directed RNA polymerase subunit M/transcription elongation factor TFIIS
MENIMKNIYYCPKCQEKVIPYKSSWHINIRDVAYCFRCRKCHAEVEDITRYKIVS